MKPLLAQGSAIAEAVVDVPQRINLRCLARQLFGDHLLSRNVCAIEHIPPLNILEVVSPQQLMMNTMVARFENTRHADVEQSVIERRLEHCAYEPHADHPNAELKTNFAQDELKHVDCEQVHELARCKLHRVGVDAIECATMWDNSSVMMLVDPRVDLGQMEEAVERNIHRIINDVQSEHLQRQSQRRHPGFVDAIGVFHMLHHTDDVHWSDDVAVEIHEQEVLPVQLVVWKDLAQLGNLWETERLTTTPNLPCEDALDNPKGTSNDQR